VREITIQFAQDLFDGPGMNKNIFDDIHQMLQRARLGLTFSLKTIMRVYPQLDTLAHETEPFEQYMSFLKMMHELARAEDARVLASSSFARADDNTQSRRIKKVEQYISEHYAEDIRLEDLSALVGMAPSAFSRFFHQRTGRTVVDYITDIRLGNAARLLVDTTQNISEVCYSCGFNNLSNFNRVFKAKRGYTPRDFRTLFKKTKVFV
jgi:AraC-like DNA-binding protein